MTNDPLFEKMNVNTILEKQGAEVQQQQQALDPDVAVSSSSAAEASSTPESKTAEKADGDRAPLDTAHSAQAGLVVQEAAVVVTAGDTPTQSLPHVST